MTMSNQDDINNSEEQKLDAGFDITGLLLDYASHWKWFLLSVAVVLAGAYYYIATIVPTYQVSASIYLNDESAEAKYNALSFDDPLLSAKSFIDETEIEVLKSRNNLVNIVDSLGLAYSYYTVGRMRNIPLYNNATVIMTVDSASLRSLTAPIEADITSAGNEKYNIKVKTSFKGNNEEKELNGVALPARVHSSPLYLSLCRTMLPRCFSILSIISRL